MKRISCFIILLMLVALPLQAQHLVKPDSLYQTILGVDLAKNGNFALGTMNWTTFPYNWAVRFGKTHIDLTTTELITNGDFEDSSSGWNVSGFVCNLDSTASADSVLGYIGQSFTGTAGHNYRVAFKGYVQVGDFSFKFGNTTIASYNDTIDYLDTLTLSGGSNIAFVIGDTLSGKLDDISVSEVFPDSSAITNSNINLIAGKSYQLSYYIDTLSGGNVTISLGSVSGTTQTDTGTFTDTITFAGTSEIKVSAEMDSNLVANIDNISVKVIDANTEDIIDLGSEYGWLSITAIDTGASITDSIKIYSGLMRTDPVSGATDTVYTLVSLRNNADYDGGSLTTIASSNATSSYFILKPYARLLKIKLENAQSIANRKWKYILEGHK